MATYCPKCKSELYPIDADYIRKFGICSYCITFSKGGVNGKSPNKGSGKNRLLGVKGTPKNEINQNKDLQGDDTEDQLDNRRRAYLQKAPFDA